MRVFQRINGRIIITRNPVPGSVCIPVRFSEELEQETLGVFRDLARDEILFLFKTDPSPSCAAGTLKCIGNDLFQMTEYGKR